MTAILFNPHIHPSREKYIALTIFFFLVNTILPVIFAYGSVASETEDFLPLKPGDRVHRFAFAPDGFSAQLALDDARRHAAVDRRSRTASLERAKRTLTVTDDESDQEPVADEGLADRGAQHRASSSWKANKSLIKIDSERWRNDRNHLSSPIEAKGYVQRRRSAYAQGKQYDVRRHTLPYDSFLMATVPAWAVRAFKSDH